MIICSCHALSDHDVYHVITEANDEPLCAERLHGCFGCQLKCGRCVATIQSILDNAPTKQIPPNQIPRCEQQKSAVRTVPAGTLC